MTTTTPKPRKSRFKQGYYTPKHPEKYIGDITKIRYMSSYELSVHEFLDNNPNVIRWGSEIIAIPYLKPTDKRLHKYYPDYYVEYRDKNGSIKREILEVKPLAQTKRPRANSKHVLYEELTHAINIAKWQACQAWCTERGIMFRIITEKSIFK